MASVKPILRIFDYDKAIEFYADWLGFAVDWDHTPAGAPVYMQISLGDIVLHLSEHHGDCCPGARVYIDHFKGLREYHQQLLVKAYKYNRPGIGRTPWNTLCMEVIDPFGNRLSFNERES